MPFSQGSRTGLSYVAETTFGVTPSTPSLLQLPYLSSDLDVTKTTYDSEDIIPDRQLRFHRHGTRSVAGSIDVDLRKAVYDPFIESAMFTTFSSNVAKIGTTIRSFTIEEAAEDITQYRLYTGMVVDSFSVDVKPNQNVKTTFGLVGKDHSIAATSLDAVKTAAANNQPFDSFSGSLKIADAGGSLATSAELVGVSFTLSNDLSPTFTAGQVTTPQLEYGRASVTGELTAYFQDAALMNRFLNETETAIELIVNAPGSTAYTFLLPRVKFDGAKMPVSNLKSRMITLPFVALYDNTEATLLKVTRTV